MKGTLAEFYKKGNTKDIGEYLETVDTTQFLQDLMDFKFEVEQDYSDALAIGRAYDPGRCR